MKPQVAQKVPENIGNRIGEIPVELSTRFLEHFSEQLYSSPQKAFEELISNGWDAGADYIDVRISEDLSDPYATMCVLDNGSSMDLSGLQDLWHIAFSPKEGKAELHGRKIIGKFGIGKLATYVLADHLTYICKSSDGLIRRVTMDFGKVDEEREQKKRHLISELTLPYYEVNETDVQDALKNIYGGEQIYDLIQNNFVKLDEDAEGNEFGGIKSDLKKDFTNTWTLVVLSKLKETGKQLKIGVLKKMLQAALPFSSEMTIKVNEERLQSSKITLDVMKEWIIGPDLNIKTISFNDNTDELGEEDNDNIKNENKSEIKVSSGLTPYPYVDIDGIGKITGTLKIFYNKINTGKSEDRGTSNGFLINVLGRVVNQNDPEFGEKNLSHAAWGRFRMAVRADGLKDLITTNREQFKDRRELRIFRAFLRRVFNIARSLYDNDVNAGIPDGGDILVQSLGVLSLTPLRNIVSETLKNKKAAIPNMFDESDLSNREEKLEDWIENTSTNIKNALGEIKYDKYDDDSFAKFRISDSSIIVNKEHPFVLEHSKTKGEKELIREVAMVNLLTDFYLMDQGIDTSIIKNTREYRDKLFRYRALQQRKSGSYITKLLLETQHDSSSSKKFELVISDALRYLGFNVKDLAKSGEPEGIAYAYSIPSNAFGTDEEPEPPLYKFTFDAKSSIHDTAATGNIKLDGIVEHRNRYEADYALVIAPGYQSGAIITRCSQQKVTPITAFDLGTLLEYTVEYGAIPVNKLRELFSFYDPNKVSKWVTDLKTWIKKQRPFTIDLFLKVLTGLKGKIPDALAASTIAFQCREKYHAINIQESHVIALINGLSILVPDLIGIDGDKIVVNAKAELIGDTIKKQLENIHESK